jgi:spoIIIJ-associated protein
MPWITKEGRTVDEARDAAVGAAGLPTDALEIEVVSEGAKGLFGLGGEPAIVRVRPLTEAADVRGAFQDDITPAPTGAEEHVRAPSAPVERQPRAEVADFEADESAEESPGSPEEADDASEEQLPLSQQQEEAARIGSDIVKGIIERMALAGDVTTRVAGGTVYIEIFGEDMGILIGRGGATLEALQEIVRAGVQRRLHTRQALVVDIEAYWERRRSRGGRGRGEDGNRRGGSGQRRGGGNRREQGNRKEP